MKLEGPYLTLGGGLAVAAVLLALSVSAAHQDAAARTQPVAAAQPAATTTAAPKPAPTPEDASTPSGTYAGSVKGGGASVAVAIKGGTAIAYVCDGSTVEAWMQGDAGSTALSLKGKTGSALTAKYADGRLSGTVKVAGKKWAFKVSTVKAPSGLYRAARNVRKAKVVGGWIIYQGGQVGMLNRDGVQTPAPPIDVTTGTVIIDGTKVQVGVLDGPPAD